MNLLSIRKFTINFKMKETKIKMNNSEMYTNVYLSKVINHVKITKILPAKTKPPLTPPAFKTQMIK